MEIDSLVTAFIKANPDVPIEGIELCYGFKPNGDFQVYVQKLNKTSVPDGILVKTERKIIL